MKAFRDYALVGLGGLCGGLLRGLILLPVGGSAAPWATLAINAGGSLLMGAFMALSLDAARLRAPTRLFLTTGAMGGFTTFSAYEAQAVALGHTSPYLLPLYTVGTLVLAVAACLAGQGLVHAVWVRPRASGVGRTLTQRGAGGSLHAHRNK